MLQPLVLIYGLEYYGIFHYTWCLLVNDLQDQPISLPAAVAHLFISLPSAVFEAASQLI